jgi:hypothetical protein
LRLKHQGYFRHNQRRASERTFTRLDFQDHEFVIGLETGVIPGDNHVIAWDGTQQEDRCQDGVSQRPIRTVWRKGQLYPGMERSKGDHTQFFLLSNNECRLSKIVTNSLLPFDHFVQ